MKHFLPQKKKKTHKTHLQKNSQKKQNSLKNLVCKYVLNPIFCQARPRTFIPRGNARDS